MTRPLTLLIAAAVANCLVSATFAAEEQDSDRALKQRYAALFNDLDSNRDGSISADEVPDESRRLFERLKRIGDKNGDGKLNKEEFVAGLEEDRPDGPPRGFGDRPGRGPDRQRPDGQQPDRRRSDGDRPDARRPDGDRPDARRDGDRPDAPRREGDRPDGRRPDSERRRGPEGRPEGMRGPMMGPALMRALDTNGDGKISSSEISDAAVALKKLDKNGDGEISREELMPPQMAGGFRVRPEGEPRRPASNEPRRPERGDQRPNATAEALLLTRLKQFDKNGDGKFKKDELPERMQERFEQMDGNSDGVIDEAELKKALPRLMRRFAEGSRPGVPEGGERRRPDRSDRRDGEGRKAAEKND